MSTWRIEMLGGFRAIHANQTVDRFPTQRTAALLAYLALFPRSLHSREVLADLFWPDADLESQRHSLRLALSRLRTAMGPNHPLVTDRFTASLDPSRFVTDVAEFEGAAARGDSTLARQLYQGPLLPGHYDEWITDEQVRLESLLDGLSKGEKTIPDNLPRGLGKVFGRKSERNAIKDLLAQGRIVTLTGPGGIGKTRLAAATAQANGRAIWLPLADISEPSQAANELRTALRLPAPAPGFATEDLVARELADVTPALLVVDNAEHLRGPELNGFLSRMARIPGISLLITSRLGLGLEGETEFPVGPLPIEEGAALFEDRARRARPEFIASNEALQSLSRRLGGMPLALELAAARAGVQGLAQIEASEWTKENDFGEALGIPERHRSLETVLKSSLSLIPKEVRAAFHRLGVFRGGFDAAAALAVAGAGLATLDTLRRWALILVSEEPDGTMRFRMPEPLRDVSRPGSGDASKVHARYFAEWIEANRADELPPPPREFGQRLALQERERDNILAVLETCRASSEPAEHEIGLRIVAAYWTHWYVRNEGAAMERWATSVLQGPGEQANPLIRASAQLSLALAVRERGGREECAAIVENALTVLMTGPRDRNLAFAWHLRGFSLADLGKSDGAEAAYLEAEAIWREIADLRNFSITRHNRGMLAADLGDLDKAEALVGEAMEIFVEHHSTYVAIAHATIASIHRTRKDYPGAVAALKESSRFHHKMGYVRGWAQNERDLALCLYELGAAEEATSWADGALTAFQRVGDRHGEATTLAALARITGNSWHADAARRVMQRHGLPAVGELLESL